MSDRPHETIEDFQGREITLPTTTEEGDWFAECKCGFICGGTYGRVPGERSVKHVACPMCGAVGEPDIIWREATNEEVEANE